MNNIKPIKNDTSLKEYRLYKVEVVVEEDDLAETLEGLIHYGVSPAIHYQVS